MKATYAVWHAKERKVYYNLHIEQVQTVLREAPESVSVRMPQTNERRRDIAVDRLLDKLAEQTGKEEWWDAVDADPMSFTTHIYPERAR